MKLSDFCRWTAIDRESAKRCIKDMYRRANNSEPLATDLERIAQDLKPLQQLSIAKKHPQHLRRIIITCDANGNASAEMVGEWTGKLMGLVARSIGPNGQRMYQRYMRSLRTNSPLPTFRSGPTAEEVKEEAREHKAKMLKAQKARQGEDEEIVDHIIEEVDAEKEAERLAINPNHKENMASVDDAPASQTAEFSQVVNDMEGDVEMENKPETKESQDTKTQTTEVMQTEMPKRAVHITQEQLEAATGNGG